MYVQGVSTRKVAAITEQMCGFAVSSSQVSEATAELDEQLQAWRERPLGLMKYVYLDARYEKVRQDGQVRNSAVLLAVGVNEDGNRNLQYWACQCPWENMRFTGATSSKAWFPVV